MAVLDREPFQIVIKLYLFPRIAVGKARQIETLSQYALLKMPRIYQVLEKEQTGFSHDVLFMEYIEGVNAGNFDVSELSEKLPDIHLRRYRGYPQCTRGYTETTIPGMSCLMKNEAARSP